MAKDRANDKAPTPTLERKEACAITPGHLVVYEADDGAPLLCLKAEREGKEYVHHYLVQLDPAPEAGHCLIYVDPEQELIDCAITPNFTLNDAVGEDRINRSDVGYIIETSAGVFLKVTEDPKMQKFCGFVDIRTGEVKRRQERGVIGFYPDWRPHDATDPAASVLHAVRDALNKTGA